MPANFVHLRLHSAYSLAESTLRIKSLSGLIADDHQPAAAITDTNNMFGALEFAQTLIGAGIQPIMGTQLNLEDTQGHIHALRAGRRLHADIEGAHPRRVVTLEQRHLVLAPEQPGSAEPGNAAADNRDACRRAHASPFLVSCIRAAYRPRNVTACEDATLK